MRLVSQQFKTNVDPNVFVSEVSSETFCRILKQCIHQKYTKSCAKCCIESAVFVNSG